MYMVMKVDIVFENVGFSLIVKIIKLYDFTGFLHSLTKAGLFIFIMDPGLSCFRIDVVNLRL